MGKKKQTIGYWYHLAFHHGLGIGPCDAFLEFRGGDKVAWKGVLTESGAITIDNPNLWGGEKDQGGIVGELEWMNGEPDQLPNAYLSGAFGDQQPAWRGLSTVVFKGGKYGAMNPYPQKPSYKIRKIKLGWGAAGQIADCWYPERAAVVVAGIATPVETFRYGGYGSVSLSPPQLVTVTSPGWTISNGLTLVSGLSVVAKPIENPPTTQINVPRRVQLLDAADAVVWDSGWFGDPADKAAMEALLTAQSRADLIGPISPVQEVAGFLGANAGSITQKRIFLAQLRGGYSGAGVRIERLGSDTRLLAMNPAHILYYARTHPEMGREMLESINEPSFIAAANWFQTQGFGLCTEYDPSKESVEEFEQRICRVAGCGLTRSLIDGQWYIDVANGEYNIATLPVLGDDDILDYEEQPSILDSAVNSVSVKYFDPAKKETITTAPVQAPALIADFGTNHLTIDYPEIPTGDLAARVAQRELLARITPLRVFSLKTSRHPYTWRPSTYFRLQAPKRRISDMVCLLGEKSSGVLRSGAMTLSASQDVYSMPSAAFIEVEEGVDTRPDQTPVPIVLQAAFEAPYIEVAAALSRADLAVLPPEASYLIATASDPANSRDFTLMVDAGSGYSEMANGDWCATAVAGAAGFVDTVVVLSAIQAGEEIEVGMPALWGTEIVRVDAIDLGSGVATLGRGCADTVPVIHADGERLWFYATGAAVDATEYTAGETLAAKLLTNTGSQQLALADAIAIPVEMAGRASRPYPPGQLRINGVPDPGAASGAIVVSGVHRDRVQQADQLVDAEMAGIGPEPATTYNVRYFLNGSLAHADSGLLAPSSSYTPSAAGVVRVEVEAERDGLVSYQMHVRTLAVGQVLQAESGEPITSEDNQPIILE